MENGWNKVEFRSLWEIWQDETCVPIRLRQELDDVELFDEWEEFALFACHYFLLVAGRNIRSDSLYFDDTILPYDVDRKTADYCFPSADGSITNISTDQERGYRRFAALMDRGDIVAAHGGIGKQKRETSMDVYKSINSKHADIKVPPLPDGIAFHTISRLNCSQFLLVGGRTSPDKASSNTWHYDGRVWNLKSLLIPGRFRHCAVAVTSEHGFAEAINPKNEGVLVFGGRTGEGLILDEWALWHSTSGWRKLKVKSQDDTFCLPRFGASMFRDIDSNSGWLFGGIGEHRLVHSDIWRWELDSRHEIINLINHTCDSADLGLNGLARFGASIAHAHETHQFAVIAGGIGRQCLPDESTNILVINFDGNNIGEKKLRPICVKLRAANEFPFMIGACIAAPSINKVLVIGGGAVCFSFGTYWNKSCVINLDVEDVVDENWHLSSSNVSIDQQKVLPNANDTFEVFEAGNIGEAATKYLKTVCRLPVNGEEDFLRIIASNKPVIIEKSDIGRCVEKWSTSYLKEAIGAERMVQPRTLSL